MSKACVCGWLKACRVCGCDYTIILMCSILNMESHLRHFLLTKPYTNQEQHGRYPVIVVCPHSFYYIYVQASHAVIQKFSQV